MERPNTRLKLGGARRLWNESFFSALLALCLAWTGTARAQDSTATLTGVVTNPRGEPVANALVVIVESHDSLRSGADGRFLVKSLVPGTYTVRALALGFSSAERKRVRATRGKNAQVELRLGYINCDLDCNPVIVKVRKDSS